MISKIRSESVDLPWSTCEMMEKFLIREKSRGTVGELTVQQGYPAPGRPSAAADDSANLVQPAGPTAPLSNEVVFVANIKSQIKRNKQNEVARERNKAVKSELRTRVKSAVSAVGTENEAQALQVAVKRIDMAAAKGIIHKNQAANKKSGLMRRINALRTSAN